MGLRARNPAAISKLRSIVSAPRSCGCAASTQARSANVEPLIHDPAVQTALTDQVTNQITSHLNVTGYADQAADLLSSKGLGRVGALLKSFGPSIGGAPWSEPGSDSPRPCSYSAPPW